MDDEAPPTDDVEVTPPVETHVTTLASIDPSVHTYGGFLVGPLTLMFSQDMRT